ncbi:MAG: nucleotidyltransferase [Candidatus Hydrogenedentota bacterium]|nr:MAG: nucleotidyltransferase [Candidatus Hydrogenedentota bacterium]
MSNQDVRWIQRFQHYQKALQKLKDAVELSQARALSELEQQGMIQAFEFTHELAWKTLKDFLESKGVQNLYGSKDTTREAFQVGLIVNGDAWMAMIRDRNLTSHTYNEEVVRQVVSAIQDIYLQEFIEFEKKGLDLASQELA